MYQFVVVVLSARVHNNAVWFQNKIERIENLEFLPNLKFLTLAHNFITVIEGLATLPKLGFLDLSHNFIENFDTGLHIFSN